MEKLQFDGPVVLAILDGVGLAPDAPGNAVSQARTPFLGKSARENLHISLDASGEAVGLLPDQMGNSEVGHNTMGCGQIIKHGIAHIEDAFETGSIWESDAWKGAIKNAVLPNEVEKTDNPWDSEKINPKTLHFAGIFSDGGVHSHIRHLERMIEKAYEEGVRKMRIHAIFDGRDVAPFSEPKYIQRLEGFVKTLEGADIRIASGGGRMVTVADRYENDWSMVERGWQMMVEGKADNYFNSATEAVETLRTQNPDTQDQYLPAFVIIDQNQQPVGKVKKGDSFIYFDFRADRAIEIAMAFTYYDFPYFNRPNYSPDDVYFAGLTEYNSDTHVPAHQLVPPVIIKNTLHDFLGERNISQFAISETAKFGHVTYYFNGDSYNKANQEEFQEIPSYIEPYDTRPWMKSAEITDAVLANLDKYKFVRINYPGGDMVGHFAEIEPTVIALEAIDLQLGRIARKVDELGGCMIIVADHGNAEELTDENGVEKTAHTTNRVPCIFYDHTINADKYVLNQLPNAGLSNLAATIATLLGETDYPKDWQPSLIVIK